MSDKLMTLIGDQKDRFLKLDEANGKILDFQQECLFARQQILKNPYTTEVAAKSPGTLQGAILNVAAIGISLNPALQHAFLVPRDGKICLDISYRGLTKIATDAGAIKWAKAELVYENDTFKYKGINEKPEFEADVFGDRGAIKGGYCIAQLNNGDGVLVDVMPIDEIHKVRETSKAYKKKSGPWVDWYEEMCKKTLIKRAYKTWPQTANRQRIDKAIEVINEHEGIAYTIEEQTEFKRLIDNNDAVGVFLFCLTLPEETYSALYYSFPQGEKTKYQKKIVDLRAEGRKQIEEELLPQLIEYIDNADYHGAMEILGEYGEAASDFMVSRLDANHQELLNIMRAEQ